MNFIIEFAHAGHRHEAGMPSASTLVLLGGIAGAAIVIATILIILNRRIDARSRDG
jgi:nitrate reductase gamma subunit